MTDVLEVIVSFVATAIYGTHERPRHPFFRNAIRGLAFGLALVVFLPFVIPDTKLAGGITVELIWIAALTIVMVGDGYGGSVPVALAAAALFILFLALHLILDA